MNEGLKKMADMLAADVSAVNGYKMFLENEGTLRSFGYVDKKELKRMCRLFNYTDTRSFVKGGITAAVIIGAINFIRKSHEETENKKTDKTV